MKFWELEKKYGRLIWSFIHKNRIDESQWDSVYFFVLEALVKDVHKAQFEITWIQDRIRGTIQRYIKTRKHFVLEDETLSKKTKKDIEIEFENKEKILEIARILKIDDKSYDEIIDLLNETFLRKDGLEKNNKDNAIYRAIVKKELEK
jgi:hypothetical protein